MLNSNCITHVRFQHAYINSIDLFSKTSDSSRLFLKKEEIWQLNFTASNSSCTVNRLLSYHRSRLQSNSSHTLILYQPNCSVLVFSLLSYLIKLLCLTSCCLLLSLLSLFLFSLLLFVDSRISHLFRLQSASKKLPPFASQLNRSHLTSSSSPQWYAVSFIDFFPSSLLTLIDLIYVSCLVWFYFLHNLVKTVYTQSFTPVQCGLMDVNQHQQKQPNVMKDNR